MLPAGWPQWRSGSRSRSRPRSEVLGPMFEGSKEGAAGGCESSDSMWIPAFSAGSHIHQLINGLCIQPIPKIAGRDLGGLVETIG